ncbi:hypothetical protein GOP47_0013903 [Adiantum capillus-veneris]|uniref:TOG domain-containing protein n=1 Tax=Adiantum capillus-veneris TaxID=13818 RepID=A0A9D4UQD5_ADICA|nr:hypothetical protein GOP47_0013903 [Adiantum capillus-veneris]
MHSPPVQRASANVASVVAKHAVPAGDWPELLPFLFHCSQSPQENHREVALILFSSLTETIWETLKPHYSTLQAVFVKGLQDRESERVRVAALKAVGALVGCLDTEEEVVKFRELVPHILNVSRECLANGSEEVAILAFEIFDELVESPVPVLGSSITEIVQFALEVCSNKELEINVRHQAIQILSWLSKYKPKTLVKYKAVHPILKVICPLLAEVNNRQDEDELSMDRAAAEVLDTMALSLPKKYVFPVVLDFAAGSYGSPDPNCREAAVMVLGVISEGCFEVMKKKLPDILRVVLQALQDSEQMVRGAASFALGQFAEHLQPEIVEHYETVLPCIFNVLSDASSEVQEKAYYALAAFCENLGTEILPYLEPLMAKLLQALENGRRVLQETCMSAIGAAAAAAEQAFVPYAVRVLEMMKHFMVLTKDEDLAARARATELVGIVAIAVGCENMQFVVHEFVEAAITGFSLDYSELREYTHGFLSSVAEVLKEGFVQYLPRAVPLALESCNLDDGTAVDFEDSDKEEHAPSGFGGVSSDEDNQDNRRVRNFSVRTGVLDEKAAATQALGAFAVHTKATFAPYLSQSLDVLKRHAGYFHEDVRLQAMIALKHVLTSTQAAFPGIGTVLSVEAKQVLDTIMGLYLRAFNEDEDKETVAQVCSCVVEILQDVHYLNVEPYVGSLTEAILLLLREEAICQETGDTDGEEEDEDCEHDEILMDAVTDLLPALAKCMGPAFEPILRQQFEPLMKFAKATRPPGDRTMVVASLAEVAQEIGPAIIPYIDAIMPLAIKELGSTEPTNRRNAAFCVGELCKNGGDTSLKYYNRILMAMNQLFGDSELDDAVRDNAAGAVARMIMTQPQAVPLAQVLPVFVSALPLKEDLGESMAVCSCLCNLLSSQHSETVPLIPQIVLIFAKVAASENENPEVKSLVGRTAKQLLSHYGSQLQVVLESLPPDIAPALASLMSST